MRYLIIGLGIYGTNLATDLTDMGHEVIGADISAQKVEAIKDYISTAYIIDSTDEQSLNALPLKNVDLIIVAIGENFGASVKTVALLKKMGIEKIYARAIDEIHESILQGLKVDRILTPEQRAAKDLSYEMELGTHVDVLCVDKDYYVLNFRAPKYFIGMTYGEITIDRAFGLKLIAATRPFTKSNILGIDHNAQRLLDIQDFNNKVEEGDIFTCFGSTRNYRNMYRYIN
ncbi:MAG: TrkA family potassium uptake protein [Bacteroidales bacterium]|nr:TrkA family potassium uptake protein [Bacteroidales bacterium]MBD5229486.1 TrkA family potassium uptake protein [Bacteroidales bacterium]MBD5235676.1 TrkA family potassium uptake protein [Barnesiella sp.]MBD5248347.1 TrkA family potassium uptake protein [Barnesiella sp.]